jgi:tRNA(adenine34) deaminase
MGNNVMYKDRGTQQTCRVSSMIEPPWHECFLLAWESFRAGSVPVGAVLVDGAGRTVGRGRNRNGETDGPVGQIAGSNLAHAEVNALATLPPGDYPEHVLYSTLEPCFFCTLALRHSHVGAVRFAAADPMWRGIEELPALNPHLRRRWTRRDSAIGGRWGNLAMVLLLVQALESAADSIVDCYATTSPDALRIARGLAGPVADELRSMSLAAALEVIGPQRGGCVYNAL